MCRGRRAHAGWHRDGRDPPVTPRSFQRRWPGRGTLPSAATIFEFGVRVRGILPAVGCVPNRTWHKAFRCHLG
jgi:hypothetical protein